MSYITSSSRRLMKDLEQKEKEKKRIAPVRHV